VIVITTGPRQTVRFERRLTLTEAEEKEEVPRDRPVIALLGRPGLTW